MMPFRQPAVRTLDVRPVSPGSIQFMRRMTVFCVVMGLLMVAGGAATAAYEVGDKTIINLVVAGAGVLVCVIGIFMWVAAHREGRSVVRVSVSGVELVLDWLEGKRVTKTERVPLSNVVEVVVTDSPTSGGSWIGLSIGMRDGEIVLGMNAMGAAQLHHCVGECRRLAEFLGVPPRLPT